MSDEQQPEDGSAAKDAAETNTGADGSGDTPVGDGFGISEAAQAASEAKALVTELRALGGLDHPHHVVINKIEQKLDAIAGTAPAGA